MTTRRLPLPPGPRTWNPLGVSAPLRRDTLGYFSHLESTYGDICTFMSLGTRYIIVNSPDLVREILLTQADAFFKGPALRNSRAILGEGLLTAEGETHRSQRRLIQPAFHAKQVERYAPDILQCTRELAARWRSRLETAPQQAIDIRPDMMGLTLVIAGRTLFGAMLEADIQTVQRCMNDLMDNYLRSVLPWGKLLNMLPLPSTVRLAKARADLFGVVERIIRRRRELLAGGTREAPRDLLGALIAATDEGDSPDPAVPAAACPFTGKPSAKAAARLTDQQLRDQCITILTAGHETTANAMTFTLHLLAKHPEEQRLLREEITTVLAGKEPAPDMLDQLPRTRWVLSESMRLLPPAWTMGRQNQREIILGGYRIPPQCTVLIPQWTLHRSPRFFSDPLAFQPARWENPTHPRFAYIPFSTGPRNCIGESFAWLEMMLALPMLVQAFEFSLPPDAPDLTLAPAITLRPRGRVELHLR